MRTEENYIRCYSGKKAWPLDLLPEDVDIVDIAHALSNQCRFTGHTREFYSVAQHSLMVCERCPDRTKLAGLLHDADEAYLVDLATPIKHGPGMEIFRELGKKIQQVIYTKYGVLEYDAARIKPLDREVYEIERMGLMPSGDGTYQLTGMLPREAERKYLERFYQLTCNGIGGNDFGTCQYQRQ